MQDNVSRRLEEWEAEVIQLRRENAQLSLEVVDLAQALAAAEAKAENAYDQGWHHGRATAGLSTEAARAAR
jgi:hypothetical protein